MSGEEEIKAKLMLWYRENKRKMPWRTLSESLERKRAMGVEVSEDYQQEVAYSTWVSEIMLQQTRVATVIPYYEKWMLKWPNVHALAKATEEEIHEVWSGLGYYSRGRNLRMGAIYVCDSCEGKIPDTVKGLLSIKGIGPYTAGAIASIAFHRAVPLVDGNVKRVLGRVYKVDKLPSGQDEVFWGYARGLVSETKPGMMNQALMELGASLCSAKKPQCDICPIRDHCQVRQSGLDPVLYPPKKAKAKPSEMVVLVRVCYTADEQVLVRRRPKEGLLAGLLECPTVEVVDGEVDMEAHLLPLRLSSPPSQFYGSFVHIFTHIRQSNYVEGVMVEYKEDLPENYQWIPYSDFSSYGVSSSMKKILPLVFEGTPQRRPKYTPITAKRKGSQDPSQTTLSFPAKKLKASLP